jgi:hypothetical protein|uniref:Uncharacterized protein n=1 Tax=virus sp. ctfPt13 TaxID=2826811 RepID=A0A8S5R7P1_9VIRU|nr:MAG TPA: hypothetical protein [virus sp. ctfPt13]
MSRIKYTGYIAVSLCKGIRRDNKAPMFACKDNKKSDCAGLFDFVMSHYAGEVARMRAGARRGDVV